MAHEPQSSLTQHSAWRHIIAQIDTPTRLLALIVLALEALVIANIAGGNLAWYVLAVGALGLVVIAVAVLHYSRGTKSQARDTSSSIETLRKDLQDSNFVPHLIAGLSRDGLAVAADLSHNLGGRPVPVISFWPHEDTPYNALNSFDIPEIGRSFFPDSNPRKILIVDDACGTGRSLRTAYRFIEEMLSESSLEHQYIIKTAVLETRKGNTMVARPDFSAVITKTPKTRHNDPEPDMRS